MAKPYLFIGFFMMFFLGGCAKTPLPPMVPYVIKKVHSAPIELPTLIIQSSYGTKKVHPSIWNAKTLKFSGGMPQKIRVQKGDSVYSLSKKYAVPIPLIIEKNKLKAPFAIYPNQVLILVGPQVHIVEKGENLYEIALKHGVSLSALTGQNKISAQKPLQEGEKLILPAPPASSSLTPKVSNSKDEDLEKHDSLNSSSSAPSKGISAFLAQKIISFIEPVQGSVISKFGNKGRGLFNDGINIAAPFGTRVRSAENGLVVYEGSAIKSYGNLVLIKHANDWMTAYAHLNKIHVKKGQMIKKNDVIGDVGRSGFVEQPQLHFEIRKNGKPQDPLFYLKTLGIQ
ncbi:MAG: peptidoglycan DD-metalloendopeptidase family protein [Alphaproteobacteria bacterium]